MIFVVRPVIPREQTPASAQQQLGSDDNKLPPGGTQTQGLQVDAGVKVGFIKCYIRAAG